MCSRENPYAEVMSYSCGRRAIFTPSVCVCKGLSGVRVEAVNEEKAARCLQRIDLLSAVREEVRYDPAGLLLFNPFPPRSCPIQSLMS